jgi:RNA polymerase sigma-70 factor (ECF subfamily)
MDEIEAIYRRYARAVFRFAWGLTGDRSRAEDIVSETFVRLLARPPKVATETAVGYLLAIARSVHVSGWRRRRREVDLPAELRAEEPDPALRLDERDELRRVLAELAQLPEGEREALLLRVDHDLSYEEIGSILEISAVAARVRVHRARVRLAGVRSPQGRPS